VKKNVLCEKGDEITRFDGNHAEKFYLDEKMRENKYTMTLCEINKQFREIFTKFLRGTQNLNFFVSLPITVHRTKISMLFITT
jgi:hypothetical protein